MKLTIHPLTPDSWPAFEDLLAPPAPALAASACIDGSAAPIAGRAVTSALIAAALKTARRAKAPALEAYPFDADVSPSASRGPDSRP
jgi:hypothetical protein